MTQTGIVQRVILHKGFGWIRTPDGNDWFFHRSELRDSLIGELAEGQQVKFSAVPGAPKGPRANDVYLLKEETPF